jgi:formamidopyrimidine-DNA glycosylase
MHVLTADDTVIRINLGMSGRFVEGDRKPKHIRWAILVDNGQRKTVLKYVDPRSFGRLEICKGNLARLLANRNSAAQGVAEVGLGPDVLSRYMMEGNIDDVAQMWHRRFNSNLPIKVALLDQSRIAGIGNIYASEICHLARIHPLRPASSVNSREFPRLVDAARKILPRAVVNGGTSFGDANTFRNLKGREGQFQPYLLAYGREGQKCRKGHKIVCEKVGGRSTFFCPTCQRQ